ncbi:MAG: septation protein SpoVG family protein [Candidatus Omnitrophica bacterium]|nr:septation protein SpoVG family protein [Candidatus Omnitrophota bacterium]
MEAVATDVAVKRLVKFDGEGSLKAYCDLAVGDTFLIKGLRVVEGKNGLFVSMPRQQGKDQKWYDSVVALTKEAKQEVSRVVLEAYSKE